MEIPTQEQYRQGYPTITFSDRMTLKIGAHTFQIMLLPGHTAGQTSVYVPEEKVLFASDNVSSMGGASMHDAKPYKWLESLQYMKRLDVDCIATGHGDVITSDPESYIDQQASAVRARIEVVEKAKAEGTRVGELAEQWDEIFPPSPRPASEGFTITRKTKSDSSGKATSRGNALYTLNHLYQVIGGNNGS